MYIFVTARNWIKLGLKQRKFVHDGVEVWPRNWIKLGLKQSKYISNNKLA